MINAVTHKTMHEAVHKTILPNQIWLASRRWAGLVSRRWAGLGKLFCVFALFIFCLLLPLNSFAKPGALPEKNLAGPALGGADFLGEAPASSTQHLENPENPENPEKSTLTQNSL